MVQVRLSHDMPNNIPNSVREKAENFLNKIKGI